MTLEELKSIHAAMTPVPWESESGYVGSKVRKFVTSKYEDGFLPWCDSDANGIVALHNHFADLVRIIEAQREACRAMLEEYEAGRNIQPFEIREMCRKALAMTDKPLEATR